MHLYWKAKHWNITYNVELHNNFTYPLWDSLKERRFVAAVLFWLLLCTIFNKLNPREIIITIKLALLRVSSATRLFPSQFNTLAQCHQSHHLHLSWLRIRYSIARKSQCRYCRWVRQPYWTNGESCSNCSIHFSQLLFVLQKWFASAKMIGSSRVIVKCRML